MCHFLWGFDGLRFAPPILRRRQPEKRFSINRKDIKNGKHPHFLDDVRSSVGMR
jgi:hypothetical protein